MRKLSEYIEIGRINNTHGIRGEMKVEIWADDIDEFLSLSSVYSESGEEIKIESSRRADRVAVVKFEGISNPEDGAKLKGKHIYAKRSDLTLPEGRYYICDLIGLPVFNIETNEKIGEICDILEKPASFVYTVKTAKGEFMIPDVEEFIKKVDIYEGMYIKVIEGLID